MYPKARRTQEELEVLAQVWGSDLDDLSDQDLDQALRQVRRTCRYFPNPAEILEAHQALAASRPRPPRPAPPPRPKPTEAETARAKAHIARIQAMLRGTAEPRPPDVSGNV